MLKDFSQTGDFQICAQVFLVTGDTLAHESLQNLRSRAIMFYIKTLQKQKLFIQACEVIKLCPSTCSSPYFSHGRPFCEMNRVETGSKFAENTQTPRCSICGLPVVGESVWCPVCGHGGHIEHIKTWFSKDTRCPSGCGHICRLAIKKK